MKLFFHYCSFGFGNCYILAEETENDASQSGGAQKPPRAILIDPGVMDENMLKTIEDNNFDLQAVLITHDHLGHVRGLRTLKRIYDIEVFAVNRIIQGYLTTLIKDGDTLNIGGFWVEVISIPGHSADSVVYRVDFMLFTGDVLTAGLVGSTASAYGAATQMNKLRSRLLSLPGDYLVLPGHGPPSTLEAERRFNAEINHYDPSRKRKPAFRITF